MKAISFPYEFTMIRLQFLINNVNLVLSENALIDTYTWRELRLAPSDTLVNVFDYHESKDGKHIYKSFVANDATVMIDGYKPSIKNKGRAFFDFELSSLSDYLFSGKAVKGYTSQNLYRYENDFDWNFNNLQWLARYHSGIGLKVFGAKCSRYHVGIHFNCGTPKNAVRLRDYWFENVELKNFPAKNKHRHIHFNGNQICYFNCPSYVKGSKKEPNQTIALYTVGKYLRAEYRRNTAASVRALINSSLGRRLKLENNLRSLSRPDVMNKILWRDLINFFGAADLVRIIKAYSL